MGLADSRIAQDYGPGVDDVVIVSGHNLGTAPIEDANEHPAVWSCYCRFPA
jgi:hypothetical protein